MQSKRIALTFSAKTRPPSPPFSEFHAMRAWFELATVLLQGKHNSPLSAGMFYVLCWCFTSTGVMYEAGLDDNDSIALLGGRAGYNSWRISPLKRWQSCHWKTVRWKLSLALYTWAENAYGLAHHQGVQQPCVHTDTLPHELACRQVDNEFAR